MGSVKGSSPSRRPLVRTAGTARTDGRAGMVAVLLSLAGAALLAASASEHLDLYLTGYRTIPVIGWMFLLQVIAAFALTALIVAGLILGSATGLRLLSAAGAVFAIATLGGYLLSLWVGLFGFREVRTTAGVVAGILEIAAFAALAFAAAPLLARFAARAGLAVAGAAVVAAAVFAGSVATASSGTTPVAGGGQELMTGHAGGVAVLTNAKGLTLYWFAPDTATASKCTGDCAAYWPPVFGKPTAGPGVTGTLGTITRPDGSVQATYDGHPLYTYVGDGAPGQNSGNNLNLNGGLWHEVTP